MSCANRENNFNNSLTLSNPSNEMSSCNCNCHSAVSLLSDTACHNADAGPISGNQRAVVEKAIVEKSVVDKALVEKAIIEKAVILPSIQIDYSRFLPPIGVFWDIENCQIPRRKSAVAIVQTIKNRFFSGFKESEFVVVCDVTKEHSRIIEELNYSQISLIHVTATCKNAADDKLRQCMRRFADTYSPPAAVILISSDINFAGDLNDLRYRRKFHVILIHNDSVSDALLLCADEHHRYGEIVEEAITIQDTLDPIAAEVIVSNLPKDRDLLMVKSRLRQLFGTLGGRLNMISRTIFSVRFPAYDIALRAQRRMDGEDVFGNHIVVSDPISVKDWSFERALQQRNRSQGCGRHENHRPPPLPVIEPFLQDQHQEPQQQQLEQQQQQLEQRQQQLEQRQQQLEQRQQQLEQQQQQQQQQQDQQPQQQEEQEQNQEPEHQQEEQEQPEQQQQQQQQPELQLQEMPKNISLILPNNSSQAPLPKIPNTENLRIIQNPTSSNPKLHLNNSETYAGILGSDADQRKQLFENMKLTNVLKNQQEYPGLRLNNSTSNNNEFGMNSVDSNPMLQAQGQKFQLLGQNVLVQRNITPLDVPVQQLMVGEINRTNGSIDSAVDLVIRGVHGGGANNTFNDPNNVSDSNGSSNNANHNKNSNISITNNNNNNNNNNNDNLSKINTVDEDSESTFSGEDFFEPVQKPATTEYGNPVDLHISGLDPYMDLLMTKNFLTSMFKMHVEVISVSVFCLTDGNVVASVKVPTLQDAQYAISQLQRRQIGSRRITIAFQNSSKCHRQIVRSQVAQLLLELPQNKTPLFRFTELFKSRFLSSISVSELKKMKDVCIISEEENGRMISANIRCQSSILQRQEKKESIIPYCPVHAIRTLSDSEPVTFPIVKIGLSLLNKRVEKLLDSHGGKLPLASVNDCYEAEFGPLPEDNEGVPLEHLVACVPGTEITQNQGSFKYLTWSAANQAIDDHSKCVSPMLVATMAVFTREILELLKETPRCILPFSQFIPSYHRRYGRQCRVSDYGFTKLLDLLESLPHVLQVMGNGSYKMVTLSHKAQIRRFTSDLVRILKNQTNKQLELSNFASQYERITGRVWDPCYYGLCDLEDLLDCVSPMTVAKDVKDGQVVISIPKREQTPEEVELTKKFAIEVVELLKRVPNCSMAFNRFVPAYHNQFGRQCRVSSYGCFKLIELFEAIPDTVNIEENTSRGEKYVVLTPAKRLQVLAERVCQILATEGGSMPLVRLEFVYKFYQYDAVVSPPDYGCETFEDLLHKINQYVEIEGSRNGPVVVLRNEVDPFMMRCRIRYILLEKERLSTTLFVKAYTRKYKQDIDVFSAVNKNPEVAKIIKKGGESFIQLTSLSVFANQMYFLLFDHRGRVPLPNFESAYFNKFKKPCQPLHLGYPTMSALLTAIPETVTVQNGGYYTQRRVIALNPNLKNAGFIMPVLNNENASQKFVCTGLKIQENIPRAYDLWKSGSLFSCWNDINFIPDNVKIPHPSELPIPSPKLSAPLHKRLMRASELHNETGATSTTTYQNCGNGVQVPDCKMEANKDLIQKKKNRIAAQFDNFL